MGAVAWGALGSAVLLTIVAVRLARWRRRLGRAGTDVPLDLAAAEADLRAEDLAFDAIVGNLLLTDPTRCSLDPLSRPCGGPRGRGRG